jgi:parvulin-like peptidyl-prolyl isomerase
VVSFEQLYFDPATPGAQARIEAAKAALAAGRPATGQSSMLPRRTDLQEIDGVARDYGAEFAAALATLPVGQWSGPVRSGLGVHLVRVDAWTPAVLPPLAEVRAQVQREWENERRTQALEASYQRMRANYEIVMQAKLPSVP